MILEIKTEERQKRIREIQHELANRNLDAYLVHSTQSEFASVFYLSNHTCVWETLGVLIPREGDAILLIGPEAEPYAQSRSSIKRIVKMIEYRESAEPDYPGIPVGNFKDLFNEISVGKGIKRLGLGDYAITPLPVYNSIKDALPEDAEIVKADDIISNLRIIKSENEITLLKKAHEITEKVLDEILGKIKPGLTEKEVVGMVLESIYRNGAECEAFPQYVFSGSNTRNAISKTTYKKLERNEIIQINIGAQYSGYTSAVGRPLVIGKMTADMKRNVQFGLEAHRKTYEWIREGANAGGIAKKYLDFFNKNGFGKNYLYGPCHGTGIFEVEKPWMETNSDYQLKENMTFMADTFFSASDYGFRWEDGFRVTKNGVEEFSNKWQTIIEL
ncbi:MAG: Xaa-Pro peptidase family protein [Actinomycetota bacterium]|nr:Xaa-Pro peptidase family protein [Actinomycetota bacterium]